MKNAASPSVSSQRLFRSALPTHIWSCWSFPLPLRASLSSADTAGPSLSPGIGGVSYFHLPSFSVLHILSPSLLLFHTYAKKKKKAKQKHKMHMNIVLEIIFSHWKELFKYSCSWRESERERGRISMVRIHSWLGVFLWRLLSGCFCFICLTDYANSPPLSLILSLSLLILFFSRSLFRLREMTIWYW